MQRSSLSAFCTWGSGQSASYGRYRCSFEKVCLAAAPVFLYAHPILQVTVSCPLSVFFHLFHAIYNPYKTGVANGLQHIALGATTLTFLVLPLRASLERDAELVGYESPTVKYTAAFLISINVAVIVCGSVAAFLTVFISWTKAKILRATRIAENRSKKSRLSLMLKSHGATKRFVLCQPALTLRISMMMGAKRLSSRHTSPLEKTGDHMQAIDEDHVRRQEKLKERVKARGRKLRQRDEQRAIIRNKMKKSRKFTQQKLFKNLSAQVISSIVDTMELEKFDRNDVLFSQGDIGDKIYCVSKGRIKLVTGSSSIVGPEGIFGALDDDDSFAMDPKGTVKEKRGMTAIAEGGSVEALSLSRKKFKHMQRSGLLNSQVSSLLDRMVADRHRKRQIERFNILSKTKLFEDVERENVSRIVDAMVTEHASQGTFIFAQGDVGEKFYILMSGSCAVIIDDKQVATLEKLQPFGEAALIGNGARRTAGILCLENCELMSLDRDHFLMLVSEDVIPEKTFQKIQQVHRKHSAVRGMSKDADAAVAALRKEGATTMTGNTKTARNWSKVKGAIKTSQVLAASKAAASNKNVVK